jgi:hypothetical protein
MKWNFDKGLPFDPWAVREREGFLFWPRKSFSTGEWRWLEWATWTEQYTRFPSEDGAIYFWETQDWLTTPTPTTPTVAT